MTFFFTNFFPQKQDQLLFRAVDSFLAIWSTHVIQSQLRRFFGHLIFAAVDYWPFLGIRSSFKVGQIKTFVNIRPFFDFKI